jgi:hypothetical protein
MSFRPSRSTHRIFSARCSAEEQEGQCWRWSAVVCALVSEQNASTNQPFNITHNSQQLPPPTTGERAHVEKKTHCRWMTAATPCQETDPSWQLAPLHHSAPDDPPCLPEIDQCASVAFALLLVLHQHQCPSSLVFCGLDTQPTTRRAQAILELTGGSGRE